MSAPITEVDETTFIQYEDFELSTRGKIDERKIKSKILPKEVPLIIDISINGYSNKGNFELEVKGVKFSEFKQKCQVDAKDGEALTVKRACRVARFETHEYITRKKKITPLYKQYSGEVKVSENVNNYSFIGGEFLVPRNLAKDLYQLWFHFDKDRNTKISQSVKRVLEAKYERLELQ
jgi:hypothetical protein